VLQICPCPEPTPCYQPVLPCCNPQCPPPILPKQRPICPRAPPAPYPCLPLCRSCCSACELDPVNRRRPLIVHDSVYQNRPSGLPAECFTRRNPNVRYTVNNYVRQVSENNDKFNISLLIRNVSIVATSNGISFNTQSYYSLVWCPGQNKRIAPLSFLHGCRKRRLKD
jgi:hypothetical protein